MLHYKHIFCALKVTPYVLSAIYSQFTYCYFCYYFIDITVCILKDMACRFPLIIISKVHVVTFLNESKKNMPLNSHKMIIYSIFPLNAWTKIKSSFSFHYEKHTQITSSGQCNLDGLISHISFFFFFSVFIK